MRTHLGRILAVSAGFGLAAGLVGCSSASNSEPNAVMSSARASEESATVPEGVWDVPREVQVAYVKALCTASGAKFGLGGTFDDASETCTTPDGKSSDVDSWLAPLLASDARQMLQSTQMMIVQVGVPVEGCPTPEEYNTVVDLTVTNDCVIAALKAETAYLSN